MADETYDPEQSLIARPVDHVLDSKLTGKQTVEDIAVALRAASFDFELDDLVTITTAEDLVIMDAESYQRGYELLEELASLEGRIVKHYERFDKPLNFLVRVVRSLKGPQSNQVSPVKQTLSKRLGAWKAEEQQRARTEAYKRQQVRDEAARQAQAAKAESLERVAETETNPGLAESFRQEAASVRAADVHAAPVEVESTVPVVPGGYTRTTWRCEFVDVKELLKAYVDGRCFLDEQAIMDGLQSSMDAQARSLGNNLSKAFPGTKGVSSQTAVTRRR